LPAVEHEPREADGVVGIPETPDAAVRAAVRRLSTRERDALFLRFYLDLDYLTIAEALGVEVGAVPTTLYAARKNLTRALEEVAG
jgi:DNA-directed RNA polymerase specialized sigma24 family protein